MKRIIKKFIVIVLAIALSLSLTNVILPTDSNVSVVEAATKKPKLNKTNVTLIKGETVQLKLSNAKNVKWSSNKKSVATVNKSGKVTAKKKGTAVISAKYNGKTYKCKVAVETPKLNKTTLTLTEDDEYTLKLLGTKQKVTWGSSNKKVATVKNGVVTAKSVGIAKITAKVGKKKYVCSVTVNNSLMDDQAIVEPVVTPVVIPVTSLIPSQTNLSMVKGQSQIITVSVLPFNTTEVLRLSYNSSNPAVAVVDGYGNIRAVGAGSSVITIAHGSVSTTVTVNVTVPITGISLDRTDVVMKKGETTSLQCTINPEDTTEDKTVTWSSDNTNIVTVDNGNISAVGAGTTKIKASVSGFTVECNVTVNVPIQSISLDKTNIEIEQGFTATLTATILPVDTTDSKVITWTSSNNDVATVNNGVVTAIAPGTAIITAKIGNMEATCNVVVIKQNISVALVTETPKVFSYVYLGTKHVYSKVNITDIQIYVGKQYNGNYAIKISVAGEKTYDENGILGTEDCCVAYKLYDSEGYVVKSNHFRIGDMVVGDKFKDKNEIIYSLPAGDYTLELIDHYI